MNKVVPMLGVVVALGLVAAPNAGAMKITDTMLPPGFHVKFNADETRLISKMSVPAVATFALKFIKHPAVSAGVAALGGAAAFFADKAVNQHKCLRVWVADGILLPIPPVPIPDIVKC